MDGSMIRRILVPLDGSPLAERALPHAAAVAQAFEAEIRLLRVLAPERRAGRAYVESADWRLRKSEALGYLSTLVVRLNERGLTAEARLAEGNIEEEIIASARGQDVDLIVISTHGRSGPSEFSLGGTAAKIISRAGVSIMIVRAPADGAPVPPDLDLHYERVLVPVDCSHRSDWALHLAASLARAKGSELIVAHVVPMPEMPQRKPGSPREARLADKLVQANRGMAEEYLEEVKSKLANPHLEVRTVLLVSPRVAHALHELAVREGAHLMVLSAHGHSGAGPWPYGSVSASLIAYGTTPLLIFQDLPRVTLEESLPDTGFAALTGNGWSR
jgi:nucleotide-binding universal stress UspA family protein